MLWNKEAHGCIIKRTPTLSFIFLAPILTVLELIAECIMKLWLTPWVVNWIDMVDTFEKHLLSLNVMTCPS